MYFLAQRTGWPAAEILDLPLGEARRLVEAVHKQDLDERVYQVKLSLLTQTPFSDEAAKYHQRLVEELVPELFAPDTRAAAAATPLSQPEEARQLELLERAGRSIVRRRPPAAEEKKAEDGS